MGHETALPYPSLGSRIIAADTEVVPRSLWRRDSRIPRFGDLMEWDLSGMGQPANRFRDWGLLRFAGLAPEFSLMAREIAYCMLNPAQRSLRGLGLFLKDKPGSPATISRIIPHVRLLQSHQENLGLPPSLGDWTLSDFRNATQGAAALQLSDRALGEFALWMSSAQRFAAALTGGYPAGTVWSSSQARRWAKATNKLSPTGTLKTSPIPPSIFYPLMGAAIAYVDDFSDDIINARTWMRNLTSSRSTWKSSAASGDARILMKLRDPEFTVPLHSGSHGRGEPNYRLLSLLLSDGATALLFNSPHADVQTRRQGWVKECLERGQGKIGGYFPVQHGLHSRAERIWHEGFDGENIVPEVTALRTACYIVVAATTLMRDSEIQEIKRGSITSHYGAPAIRTVQLKHRPDRPELLWWVHPIGVKAVQVAEQLSDHETHIFSPTRIIATRNQESGNTGFGAAPSIRKFVTHVNRSVEQTGLNAIPTDEVATPRKFRRTMAIQVGQQPGGELALGVILKHVSGRAIANASTFGYANPDSEWMIDYEDARLETHLREIVTSWEADIQGHRAIGGPGSTLYNEIFDLVTASQNHPIGGDRSQLVALLKSSIPGFRAGTFNHCLGDKKKARCISSSSQPGAAIDPFRCDPSKCGNSVITREHIPLLRSELRDVESMQKTDKLSSSSKAILLARRTELESLIPASSAP